MNSTKTIPIEFKINSLKVVPSSKTEKYKTKDFLIFETNHPQFYIKIFRNKNLDDHKLLKDSDINSSKEFSDSGLKAPKILTAIQNKEPEFWGVLKDSWAYTFNDMIKQSFHSYDFDIIKFIIQIGKFLEVIQEKRLPLAHLSDEMVVLDFDGNFQLTNLDYNLNVFGKDSNFISKHLEFLKKVRKDCPLAPELYNNKDFSFSSLIWDFGVLLLKVFSGKHPKVNYFKKTVSLDLEHKTKLTRSKEAIITIINSSLIFDKDKRISLSKIIHLAQKSLLEIGSLISLVNSQILSPVNISKESLKSFEGLNDFFGETSFRNEEILNDFNQKKRYHNHNDMSSKKIIKILLQAGTCLDNNLVKELIKRSWNDPKTIKDVFTELGDQSTQFSYNEIKCIKALLFLHGYISKTSKNTLLLTDKNSKNAIIVILENILKPFLKKPENSVFRLVHFLMIKFTINSKMLNICENNFAISKGSIILDFDALLQPDYLIELLNYLNYTMLLFISIRKFSFQYFSKLIILVLIRELHSILGILSNFVLLLQFGLIFYEKHSKVFTKGEIEDLHQILIKSFEPLEKISHSINIFCVQAVVLGFDTMQAFKIPHFNIESFKNIKERMEKDLTNKQKFTLRLFTKSYMNSIVRMNDAMNQKEVPKQADNLDEEIDILQNKYKIIFQNFLISKNNFSINCLEIYRSIAKARFWYEYTLKKQIDLKSGRNHSVRSHTKQEKISNQDFSSFRKVKKVKMVDFEVQVNMVEYTPPGENKQIDKKVDKKEELVKSIFEGKSKKGNILV